MTSTVTVTAYPDAPYQAVEVTRTFLIADGLKAEKTILAPGATATFFILGTDRLDVRETITAVIVKQEVPHEETGLTQFADPIPAVPRESPPVIINSAAA